MKSLRVGLLLVAALVAGCSGEGGEATDDGDSTTGSGGDSTTDTDMTTDTTTDTGSPDIDAGPQPSDPDAATPIGTIRILPLGDSLTLGFGSGREGQGSEGGYRLHLVDLLRADGIDFDLVGSRSNGPRSLDDKDHEGYNGYAVPQVAEIAATAIPAFNPHVVLLMAGTNDQITAFPPSQPPADAAEDLEALLEQIHTASPNTQIVVAQVIPLVLNDDGVREYNALLPAIVARQQARGVGVRLVDMYKIGRENLSRDGIHPTLEGYDMIADIWYPALRAAINDL